MNTPSITRLNKYISEKGICSRREADKLIEAGRVFLNGSRAKLGDHVQPGDKVMVNGQKLDLVEEKPLILLALNKPVGIVSTTETTTTDNIVDFVNHSERIFPIGRLDKDSQGLILLTNAGDLVNKILRAGNKHEKEYIVTVNKPITDEFVEGLANGVPILGEVTKKCKVVKESPFVLRMILVQGKNRQIRRMCEHFSYEVTKLERVRIMNITLKGIPLGDWRELTEDEKFDIMKSVENSSSDKTSSRAGKRPRKENREEDFHAKRMANPQHKSSSSSDRPDRKPAAKSFKASDDHSFEGELSQDGFETRKKSKPRDPEENTSFEKEKRSYKEYRSGSSRKSGDRGDRGERKSDEGRKPYADRKSEGGRKAQDGRKPFGKRKEEGGRSSEEGRRPYSDRKTEGGRSSDEGRKSYGDRKSEAGGKPWSDRKTEGGRKSDGGAKPWSDKKSSGRKADGGGKFWSDKKSDGGRKSEGRGFGKSKPVSKSPSRGGKKSSGPNSTRPKSSGR